MLEEDVAFWWEFAMRTNFVGRGQDTITSEEFVECLSSSTILITFVNARQESS